MALKRSRANFEADLQKIQSPYVFFGTPLPPLDPHTRDDGSYVPVWKQEVVDERGRKRLHGAFTGGFSAGYFNTVGSKEGWTPATFVSSRTNRAKTQQRAEDYMDEEDLADAEEAQQLETKASYAGFGLTQEEVGKRGRFMDLFRPEDETMGLKLLRRMGWRDGEGIGPRVKRKGSLAAETAGPQEANPDSEMVPPKNTKLISFVRKTDTKGLGYGDEGAAQLGSPGPGGDSLGAKEPAIVKKPVLKPRRGGIGIGILNDTGSDDEDPYEMGPKLSYGKTMAGDKKKKKKPGDMNRAGIGVSNPKLANQPVFMSKKMSGFRKCHDGRLPISGFILSTLGPLNDDKKYEAPQIPEGWKSSKEPANGAVANHSANQTTTDLAKSSTFDPSSRASLLGESVLPGKSIFDFLTPAARDKLVVASKNSSLPPARSENIPGSNAPSPSGKQQPPSSTPESLIPSIDPQIASAALSRLSGGFVPYADDPEKLSRYRVFLTFRSLPSDADSSNAPPTCPSGMQHEDWVRELHEFAHAATIFKPMTGAMASRFTSSSNNSANDNENEAALAKTLKPEEEAAQKGMWGPLTRRTEVFHPSRLLCKRFGVAPPPSSMMVGQDSTAVQISTTTTNGTKDIISNFTSRFTSGGVQVPEDPGTTTGTTSAAKKKDKLEILGKKDMDELRRASGLPELGTAVKRKQREQREQREVDPDRNEALEGERPSEETFRAIFADGND